VKNVKAEGESILVKNIPFFFPSVFWCEWPEHRDVRMVRSSGSIQALQKFDLLMKSEIRNFVR